MSERIVRAPLLVIHGTADPIYAVEHGVALSEAVKGAKLRSHQRRRSRAAPD